MFAFGTIIGYAIGSFITTLSRICGRFWRLHWIGKLITLAIIAWFTSALWLPYLR